MNSSILLEIFIILLLTIVNGVFSLSEIAVISARKPRLQQRAEAGNHGARRALELAENPNNFLSTVQVGITLITIFTGIFSGATLSEELAILLNRAGIPAQYSEGVSIALVVVATTYLSLVVGELVPKSVALNNAEGAATAVAPFMFSLSKRTSPLVRLLTYSTHFVVRLLGIKPSEEPPVTEEEVEIMLQQGAQVGIFEPGEEEMVRRIFRLSDRKVSSLMTPRREIVWLNPDDPVEKIQEKMATTGYSRFPVATGNLDKVVGLVRAKDLLLQSLAGQPLNLSSILRPPLYVPESMPALDLLERFKEKGVHIALVIDEYGGLEGLVTLNDLLEAIVGDFGRTTEPEIIQRADGSWLIDGTLSTAELMELLQVDSLPHDEAGYYQTVGGFIMAMLERLPISGDFFEWGGHHFEVMDMDGLRVDKVLLLKINRKGGDETKE